MSDARATSLFSYLLAAIIITAATMLCFIGRLSPEGWQQCVLVALAALGLTHMPSPSQARSSPADTAQILRLGFSAAWTALALLMAFKSPVQRFYAEQSGTLGIATDFVSMNPRLAPSSPGRGVMYTDSQTGRVRFLDTSGNFVEAGMADKLYTASSAPSGPVEGRVYGNTTSHQPFYYDGATWQQLATAGGAVPPSRQILCGNGLQGCGDFSADRTMSVRLAATPGLQFVGMGLALLPKPSGGLTIDAAGAYLTATGVAAGAYPSTGQIPTFTVGADGRLSLSGSTTDGSALTGVQASAVSLTGVALWVTPVVGEVGYLSGDNALSLARADSAGTVKGICVYQGTANTCQVGGAESLLFEPGLTLAAGDIVYLSATTAGRVTNVEPSSSGQFIYQLGTLLDASGYNSGAGSAQRCLWHPVELVGPLSYAAVVARHLDRLLKGSRR